jgi:hypothetical protein
VITVSTPELSVFFPDRITPLKPLTEPEADCLNRILTARMRHYVRKWLEKGIPKEEIQIQLIDFSGSHEFAEKIEETYDPLTLEARRIAREMVIEKLAKEGLMVQEQTLDIHIRAILDSKHIGPKIMERAKEILNVRRQAARDALGR